MSIEDDIINGEFSGKERTVFDAEVEFPKPKSRRLIPALIMGGIVLAIGLGGLFYDDLMAVSFGNIVSKVKKDKPAIESATPPGELAVAPPASSDTTEPTNASNATAAIGVPESERSAVPMAASVQPSQQETPKPELDASPVKPDFGVQAKVSEPASKPVVEAVQNQSANNERLQALEQRVKDLAAAVDNLTKKLDTMPAEKKVEIAKPQTLAKAEVIEKPKAGGKPEVIRSMKDLHIAALLSDGVMFEGDVAISVGQYSKTLNGRILSINTDQNTITTDSKIYRVQQ